MLGVTFPAKVTKVLDGDTIKVEVPAFECSIRLLDCWAYEVHSKDLDEKERGLAAKAFVEQLLPHGEPVTVEVPIDFDGKFGGSLTFGRILGRVRHNGKDLSETVVNAGHATPERQETGRYGSKRKKRS